MKKFFLILATITVLVIWFLSGTMPDKTYSLLPGYFEDPNHYWQESPFIKNEVSNVKWPLEPINSLADLGIDSKTQILFGDTHVHTTNSSDAFMFSLPLMHGAQGAFPPGYACDYARFVSQLDFYFLTDHAESYTPERWLDAIESVNKCNQISQAENYQDTYAFMGYEWTQVGLVKEEHYGHHNVLFKDTDKASLPSRPIAAALKISIGANRKPSSKMSKVLQLIDPRHKDYYAEYNKLIDKMVETPNCEKGVASNELPANCFEEASTTAELYKKLNEWNIDTIVVPHGTTWGWYTPPDASWETHLNSRDMNNRLTPLIEIYSGHGNSEEYRNYPVRPVNEQGEFYCPEPDKNYLTGCWQAGEIIRQRCLKENNSFYECETRAITARQNFINVDNTTAFLTVPAHNAKEWLDAEQARDMFNPAFSYRPKKSAQYGLAIRNFEDPDKPLGFQWGFIGSTDTHTARVGHGFKQVSRIFATEANGPRDEFWNNLLLPSSGEYQSSSRSEAQYDAMSLKLRAKQVERIGSFLYLGGLAAVHVDERSRDGIWQGMKSKRVYGTSGHKILLWFDMIDENNNLMAAMGSSVESTVNPLFRVTAVGSSIQAPGCPDFVKASLDKQKLAKMALGECYNPTDERYLIQRIEITRIKPQSYKNEPVDALIENNWKVFQCPTDSAKCEVTFTDDAYSEAGRDTLYYARVIEQAIPMINGNNLRTKFDEKGNAISVNMCEGSFRTPQYDECLAEQGHRAWSSPIFISYSNSSKKMKKPILVTLFIAGLFIAVAGSGIKSTLTFVDTNSIITVNNQPITKVEFARAIKKNPNLTESQLLSLMVDNLLLLQRAEELGLVHSDRVVRKVIVQHMVEQAIKHTLNMPVDEQLLHSFYQDNLPMFTPANQFQVELLQFKDDDQQCSLSRAVKQQWQRTIELDDKWQPNLIDQPLSKSLHSEVLIYRQLGTRLAKQVTQLNKGDVSEPVRTQQGCLLMKLIDSDEGIPPSYVDIKQQIISEYRVMARKKALADLLTELRGKAEIIIAKDIVEAITDE